MCAHVCLFVLNVVCRVNGPHKPKYKIYKRQKYLREPDECWQEETLHTFVDKQTDGRTDKPDSRQRLGKKWEGEETE